MKGTKNMKKKLSTRLLSGVSALLLATAVLLPSSSSAEDDPSEMLTTIKGDHHTGKSTLLAGNSNMNKGTIADTVKAYDDAYLLGVAADFNVFLQDDFTVTDSDTEGRAAVGGDINVKVSWGKYSIGKGDFDLGNNGIFNGKTSLDNIYGDDSFAVLFLGGQILSNKLDDTYYKEDQKEPKIDYRKIVVQWGEDLEANLHNGNLLESDNGAVDQSQAYISEKNGVINFDEAFNKIKQKSLAAAAVAPTGTYRFGSCTIAYDNNTAQEIPDAVEFKYTGTDPQPTVVYFTVKEEDWEKYANTKNVVFNVPKLKTPVVEPITGETWEYPYIIVNVEGGGSKHLASLGKMDKTTYVGNQMISEKNNMLGTESILYNFPEATKIILGANFQGSILAPDADVTDMATNGEALGHHGHLSGALIAQSFEGATQFGYRPCRIPFSVPITPKDLFFTKEWRGGDADELPTTADFEKWLKVTKTVDGSSAELGADDYTITIEKDENNNFKWIVTINIKMYDPNAIYTVEETIASGYKFEANRTSVTLSDDKDSAETIVNTKKIETTSPGGGSGENPSSSGGGDTTDPSSGGDTTDPSSSGGDTTDPSSSGGDTTDPSGSDDKTDPVSSSEQNPGVDNDDDNNNKTTSATTTTTTHSGVGNGGDNNDKGSGTGSDGDSNNPMTGIKLSALMLSAVSLAAAVITSKKKK